MYPQILPYLCLGYVAGVAAGSAYSPLPAQFIYLLFTVCLVLLLLWRFNITRYVFLFAAAFLIGNIASDITARTDAAHLRYWQSYAGRPVKLEGRVQTVEERDLSLVAHLESVRVVDEKNAVFPGVLEIKTDAIAEIEQDDVIQVIGKISVPENYSQGVGHFDPRRYYARYGIYASMFNPRVKKMSGGHQNLLAVWRGKLRAILQTVLPEPTAGLFSATLLGYMHDVPKPLRQDFSASGLAHLVAISGQHVAMLAIAIFFICFWVGLSRNAAMAVTGIVAFLFVALVDFTPSGVRSVIMAGAVFWSYAAGKKSQGFRVLLIAATIMLAINPRILLADLGFQLSVLAMWALLVFYPLLRPFLWRRKMFGLQDIFLMSACAIIVTTPLIAYSFGRISLVGLFANVVAGPLYPVLMLMGLMLLLFWWVPFLHVWLATSAHWLTLIFLSIVRFSAKIPGADLQLADFSATKTVLFYLALFIFSLLLSKTTRRQFWPLQELIRQNKNIVQAEQNNGQKKP